jgi:hypothetical protein
MHMERTYEDRPEEQRVENRDQKAKVKGEEVYPAHHRVWRIQQSAGKKRGRGATSQEEQRHNTQRTLKEAQIREQSAESQNRSVEHKGQRTKS